MKLSAPVHQLKRKSKRLARDENIPLHQALDRTARAEGFDAWSLLVAKMAAASPAGKLFGGLAPGDLVLLAARPGHGKTLMGLELAVEAMRSGHRSVFFSLEYTEKDVQDCFRAIGVEWPRFDGLFTFDGSDAISADHMIERLGTAPRGTLAVVDYLQLLDQRRENPDLAVQVRALKAFARDKGLIIVFISQIDRSYDPASRPLPDLRDVRLPNPLDLKLFDKGCFLNDGEFRFQAVN
ncbi:DNA helicase [Kumtagia ephedrae]|uniref:DNA helicase n=1 Tax=Kumtagia ephedrae TaxID=2116701 RepID=A0A2P7STR6_9HYPH|nr:DNA helicase [Mesorhizobium ephedrae]PSJ65837.1 DNA helicase [Mesorhizobium ephedrae]